MGRSYWFECSKCSYQAKVSGRADRGVRLCVQTIACQDCKQLFDAVTRLKAPDDSEPPRNLWPSFKLPSNLLTLTRNASVPPTLASALNRLHYSGVTKFKWIQYKLQCPISPFHRVHVWNDPGKCPKCGTYLDRTALPYRVWD